MTTTPTQNPQPTDDEIAAEIDARFRAMAREWARTFPPLIAWKEQGNKLPEVYR